MYGSVRGAIGNGRPYRDPRALVHQTTWSTGGRDLTPSALRAGATTNAGWQAALMVRQCESARVSCQMSWMRSAEPAESKSDSSKVTSTRSFS